MILILIKKSVKWLGHYEFCDDDSRVLAQHVMPVQGKIFPEHHLAGLQMMAKAHNWEVKIEG